MKSLETDASMLTLLCSFDCRILPPARSPSRVLQGESCILLTAGLYSLEAMRRTSTTRVEVREGKVYGGGGRRDGTGDEGQDKVGGGKRRKARKPRI